MRKMEKQMPDQVKRDVEREEWHELEGTILWDKMETFIKKKLIFERGHKLEAAAYY